MLGPAAAHGAHRRGRLVRPRLPRRRRSPTADHGPVGRDGRCGRWSQRPADVAPVLDAPAGRRGARRGRHRSRGAGPALRRRRRRLGRVTPPASSIPVRVADFDRVNAEGTRRVVEAAAAPGCAGWSTCRRTRPFGVNAGRDDRSAPTSPYHPYLGYGTSKMAAELAVRAAHDARRLETVVVRPPWFYGPWQPERQTRFFSLVRTGRFPLVGDGGQRRSMAYVDNLVQGVAARRAAPRRRRARLLDRRRASRTRWASRRRPSRRALARRGATTVAGRQRPAARAGRPASPSAPTARSGARPLHAGDARARRDGQDDRLRHLRAPGASSATTRGGARGGHAAHHPLVPRPGASSCEARDRRWSPGAAATSGRCSSTAARGTGARCGSSTSTTRRPHRRRRVRPRRHPRRRRVRRGRATASTSSSTTSPRCRWPGTRRSSSRSTSTAPRPCSTPRRTRGVAQGRAHLVERGLRRPGANPVTRDTPPRAGRGLRPGQVRRPSCSAGRRSAAGSTSPSCGRGRSWARPARASSASCSTGSPTAPTYRCSGDGRQPLPVRARRRPGRRLHPAAGERPGPGDVQHRRRGVRHHARGPRGPLRRTPARGRGSGRCRRGRPVGRCSAGAALGLTPFAPYHWIMYSRVAVVRPAPRPRPSWAGRPLVDRRDVPGVLRLVPRAPATTPPVARHHRSPARQGALRLAKRALRRVSAQVRARRRRGPSTTTASTWRTWSRHAMSSGSRGLAGVDMRRRSGAPPARTAPWRCTGSTRAVERALLEGPQAVGHDQDPGRQRPDEPQVGRGVAAQRGPEQRRVVVLHLRLGVPLAGRHEEGAEGRRRAGTTATGRCRPRRRPAMARSRKPDATMAMSMTGSSLSQKQ